MLILTSSKDFFTNKPHEVDKLTAARQEVANVQKIVTNNIGNIKLKGCLLNNNTEKVLERGEKIEVLVEQTEQLGNTSHTFRKQAKVVKKKMCLKNMKWTIIAVCCITVENKFVVYTYCLIGGHCCSDCCDTVCVGCDLNRKT